MGKNVILSTIIVFLIIASVSDASFLSNFRKLVASSPKEDHQNASVNGSPIPNPNLPDKQSSLVGGEEKGAKEQNPPPLSSPPVVESAKDKKTANSTNVAPSPSLPTDAKTHNNETAHKENVKENKESMKEKENEKNEEKEEQKEEEKEKKEEKAEEKEEQKEEQKEKEERKADRPVASVETCDGKKGCDDLKSMTACIKSFDHDSKLLVLLIHNKGDSNLKVDLTTSSLRNKHKVINIRKRHDKQVNVSLADSGSYDVTLNAGNGHCVLHLGAPASQGNFFQQFPSYTKFMTPIYGAYLVLAITLIAGGVFACCCWFRKRKGQRDIPYQELEMSMPESAVAVESAEGWDEVWDDDWDEENAVRSPGGHNISANGLTSRNSKKDDWEDWDN